MKYKGKYLKINSTPSGYYIISVETPSGFSGGRRLAGWVSFRDPSMLNEAMTIASKIEKEAMVATERMPPIIVVPLDGGSKKWIDYF